MNRKPLYSIGSEVVFHLEVQVSSGKSQTERVQASLTDFFLLKKYLLILFYKRHTFELLTLNRSLFFLHDLLSKEELFCNYKCCKWKPQEQRALCGSITELVSVVRGRPGACRQESAGLKIVQNNKDALLLTGNTPG